MAFEFERSEFQVGNSVLENLTGQYAVTEV